MMFMRLPKNESIEILDLDDQIPISLYRPFRFLIGETFSHENFKSFMFYISKQYLNELKKIENENSVIRFEELSDAYKKHNEFFEIFFQQIASRISKNFK